MDQYTLESEEKNKRRRNYVRLKNDLFPHVVSRIYVTFFFQKTIDDFFAKFIFFSFDISIAIVQIKGNSIFMARVHNTSRYAELYALIRFNC